MKNSGKWGDCNWTLYAWGHLSIEGGHADSITTVDEVPWKEIKEKIVSVSVDEPVSLGIGASLAHLFDGCISLKRANLSNLNTTGVVNMCSMFEGCESLSDLDLSGFNTTHVTDMTSMFMNCESLEGLNLSHFDTSNVKNMSFLFCGCEKLKKLVINGWDTSSVKNMSHMFQYCNELSNISADVFDMSNVIASEDMFTGLNEQVTAAKAEEVVKAPAEAEETERNKSIFARFGRAQREKERIEAERRLERERIEALRIENERARAEVNREEIQQKEAEAVRTQAFNYDTTANVGLVPVHNGDSNRQIYAGTPFFVGPVPQIPPIVYGERLQLRPPQIDRNNGIEAFISVEISPDGVNQWTQFNPDMIMPVSGNGCYVRYKVENWVGYSVSDPVRITIRKADYDVRNVHWKSLDNPVYDGTEKRVHLVGMPEGLQPVYYGNKATEAGEYTASVVWKYDDRNYNAPPAPEDLYWKIQKADYFMPDVKWAYNEAYCYDGETKSVVLEGVPEGVIPVYKNNQATEVGIYYAQAFFEYDENNYNPPKMVTPCQWQIKKSKIDMSEVKWDYTNPFTYNGLVKSIELTGLPDGVIAHYTGNRGTDVGSYTATAMFELSNPDGFYLPENMTTKWGITKSDIDISAVKWTYDESEPFVYDGTVHTVSLVNIPEEVYVRYYGNSSIEAGKYSTKADLYPRDDSNYEITASATYQLEWEISKADYDFGDVNWDYNEYNPFTYNGSEHSVALENLPYGVTAEYDGNVAINVGDYTAVASFNYDKKNYNEPEKMRCSFKVEKANIDLSGTYWSTRSNPEYDGQEHSVFLAAIPDQMDVEYTGNVATDAGEYYASAVALVKDENNYNTPEIRGIKWRIKKTVFDISKLEWDYTGDLTYTGSKYSVKLIGVPADFDVVYTDNEAVDAGEYEAVANFIAVTDNYEQLAPMSLHWTIDKATYDMSDVRWNYNKALIYDGEPKKVKLENLPAGVVVEYTGNTGKNVGRYAARAILNVLDETNYNTPSINGISWSIEKASYDMSNVRWVLPESLEYDGTVKTLVLEGLPTGITPIYLGNEEHVVGDYIASAELVYDDRNYYRPSVADMPWRIEKGEYRLDALRWEYGAPFTYDGQVKSVELVGLGSDINVRYSMNKAVNAGEYEAVASFTLDDEDNYVQPEPMVLSWVIEKAAFDMSNVNWTYERAFTYSGSAHVVTLFNLPEGVWADYEQNVAIDVGTYEARATFGINNSDNYIIPEPRSCQWEIAKANLDMTRAHWNYQNPLVCNGEAHEVVLTGLPEGITVSYQGNTETYAGIYEASAEIIPNDDWNFNAPKVRNLRWEVVKDTLDMSQVKWTYVNEFTYDGTEKKIVLEGLPAGVTATYFGNTATDAGSYEARVRLTADDDSRYVSPQFESCRWRIRKADFDMSKTVWNYSDSMYVYDGSIKRVLLDNVPAGVNVSYNGNSEIKAGEYFASAYFTVDDHNNYNTPDSKNLRWVIEKNKFDMSAVRWSYEEEFTYTGGVNTVELLNLPAGVAARYSGNVAVNAGSYIALANLIVDVENYEIPTVPECRWMINKALPDISTIKWDYSNSFTYDGRRKTVELKDVPQGLSVTYRNNSYTAAGVYTAEAIITADDKVNYRNPEIIPLSWSIEKADYDLSNVKWIKQGRYVYDGSEKSVWLRGLPEGVAVEYRGNKAVEAGSYIAEAILRYDKDNYNTISVASFEWSVEKANYDLSAASWNYTDNFRYDGIGKRVSLIGIPDSIKPIYENNYAVDCGSYIASATFEYDRNNYNEPIVEACEWRIKKAKIDTSKIRWDYFRPYTYTGAEQSIELASIQTRRGMFDRILGNEEAPQIIGLPEGMSVVYEGNTGVDAGIYVAKAIIIPDNPNNYEDPDPLECRWEIKKANVDMSMVQWTYTSAYTYDGSERKIALTNLPSCVSVIAYHGNTAVDVGTYIARAVFKADDNHNQPEEVAIRWKIEKKPIDLSAVKWDYDAPFVYDGKPKTVKLENIPKEVSVHYINNTNVEPGTYVTKAVFSYDQSSYRVAEIADCRWKIEE